MLNRVVLVGCLMKDLEYRIIFLGVSVVIFIFVVNCMFMNV